MSSGPLCPKTGHAMHRHTRTVELAYKGETAQVEMPGWYCPDCGESIHTGDDLKQADRALNRLKARQEKLLEPQEIRRIRKKLGLTQVAAGTLIGGGPRAFQKYESGDLLPSRAVVSALKLLDDNPKGIEVLGCLPVQTTRVGRASGQK